MSPTSSGQEIVLGNIPNVHPGVESSPSQQLSFQVLSNGSETSPHVYFNTPAWPLQDQQEARLLRHFIDNVAPFFDLCDPRRHFQITIPQRTTTCPTLLNAILAASASHLCQFAQFDSLVANFYVQECLQQLLPMMGGVTGMMDENSFAAIVILRFVEELNAPMSSSRHESPRSRLLDTHILANAPTNCIEVSSVQRASYWVCMQQDIYMSFVAQQSTLAPHEFCTADRSVAQADDWTWTKRIMLHCADLLLYCFGEGEHSVGTYDALVRQCADWSTFKPASFHPIFFKEPSMLGVDIFPEVWLLNDAAAAGIQHYHLGMILLTAHNPKAPLVGPDQRQVLKLLDDEIKGHVRIICGIAKSNGTASSPSNWRTATMAISMAGDRFRGRHEQIALMNVLDTTEKKQIWPTNTIKAHIKEAWGWRSV
ncbi:hypothetical protein BDY21DRAFT_280367 [Lineolata rhizophorae]|uniref:Fungal-specific transcription factor domain-containing protein n=1 Tax=Lineolata rhizophorae TaxID=578093 RepID=A0A6A6PA19_9PEZI|nr:hypothetical protein BDY21DRAFT_280367 [Lineolata rhizophorae]